jgi:hypothetical protein
MPTEFLSISAIAKNKYIQKLFSVKPDSNKLPLVRGLIDDISYPKLLQKSARPLVGNHLDTVIL